MRYQWINKKPKSTIKQVIETKRTRLNRSPICNNFCTAISMLYDNGDIYTHYTNFENEDKGKHFWAKWIFEE